MVTSWILHLLGGRAMAVRASALLGLAVGYLAFVPTDVGRPGVVGWSLMLASIASSMMSPRWPLAAALGQATLLALGEWAGDGSLVPLKVLASLALFELAMRARGRGVAVGAGALTTVYLIVGLAHLGNDVAQVGYKTAVVVGGPMVLGAYVRMVDDRRRQAELRAAEQERLRRSDATVARIAERTAIARELHDVIAHHVASIVLRVGVAQHLGAGDAGTRQVLDDVHDTGTSALAELRRLVAFLRDPATADGSVVGLVDPAELPAALEAAACRASRFGLEVDATIDPALAGLDAGRALAVLRVIQEGLTNAAKHAGPEAGVRVVAELTRAGVQVEVADDGSGQLAGFGQSGHGLTGLRERVGLFGGTLKSGPGDRGWRLTAFLPVEQTTGAEASPAAELL